MIERRRSAASPAPVRRPSVFRTRTASLGLAGALTGLAIHALRTGAPGGVDRWERRNHSGRTVELYPGPAVAAVSALAAGTVHPAASVVVAAAGACGAYDDIAGAVDPRRGFRAHLDALRDGDVTSGAVKALGISAAGLLAGACLKERPLDKLLAGVVIAGSAHLVNLLDVRPGRALGAVVGLGVPGALRSGAAGDLSAALLGAAAAALPGDLGERTMLGDTGAHALGAALGVAVVASNGRAGPAAHAAGPVAAAVRGSGERVSAFARTLPLGSRAARFGRSRERGGGTRTGAAARHGGRDVPTSMRVSGSATPSS